MQGGGNVHKRSNASDPSKWSEASDPMQVIRGKWSRQVIQGKWSKASDPKQVIQVEWSEASDPSWVIHPIPFPPVKVCTLAGWQGKIREDPSLPLQLGTQAD